MDKEKRRRIAAIGIVLEAVAYKKEDVEYPQASEERVEGVEVFKDGL